jgi:peptide/nickel transport system ATP-binding protein
MEVSNVPYISVKELVVTYTSGGEVIHAVNGVSFSVKKGETLGLVGETGAGKTSIAKSILRILPNPPAKIAGGEVFIEGENIFEMSEKEMLGIRGNKVSMIFQDPMTALNPVKTVGDQIMQGILLHNNVKKNTARQMASEMLKMVGIVKERFDEYPFQFSGGMKQRVIIAMALACKPGLLLADEPTTALDVTIQAQVLAMIKDLREDLGMSMILITHDLGIVAQMCDNVAVIYAGQIVEHGTRRDVFKNPAHPYTIGLFNSLPSLTGDEPRLKPILGLPPDPSNLPRGCAFSPRCFRATEKCKNQRIDLRQISEFHYSRCISI